MLATLIQTFAVGEAAGAVKRVRQALIAYAIAGVLTAIGIGFLIGAGYIYAAERFGPLHAALGIGGGFILLAIVAVVIHRIVARINARRRAKEARAMQLKTVASAAVVAVLPTLLKGGRGGLVGMAAPLLAMAAYAIYRENTGRDRGTVDDEG